MLLFSLLESVTKFRIDLEVHKYVIYKIKLQDHFT